MVFFPVWDQFKWYCLQIPSDRVFCFFVLFSFFLRVVWLCHCCRYRQQLITVVVCCLAKPRDENYSNIWANPIQWYARFSSRSRHPVHTYCRIPPFHPFGFCSSPVICLNRWFNLLGEGPNDESESVSVWQSCLSVRWPRMQRHCRAHRRLFRHFLE